MWDGEGRGRLKNLRVFLEFCGSEIGVSSLSGRGLSREMLDLRGIFTSEEIDLSTREQSFEKLTPTKGASEHSRKKKQIDLYLYDVQAKKRARNFVSSWGARSFIDITIISSHLLLFIFLGYVGCISSWDV